MYRFFLILLIFTFLTHLVLPADAGTIVTRRPIYGGYNRSFNHSRGFHHKRYPGNYRRPPHRVINRYNNPYYYNNYNNNRFYNNRYNNRRFYRPGYTTSFADIGALESYTLNKNYSKESDLERLERLEMQTFGAIQSGDINQRYDNVRSAILSRPQPTRTSNSLFRTIGNFFGGQMTGFTPSFDNDPFFSDSYFNQNPYPTTYGTQSASTYSRPFGGGSRIQNYGTGSTCGVQLLD